MIQNTVTQAHFRGLNHELAAIQHLHIITSNQDVFEDIGSNEIIISNFLIGYGRAGKT